MKSFVHRIGQGLLTVGVLALGYPLLVWVYADGFQAYQQWAFDRLLQTIPPVASLSTETNGVVSNPMLVQPPPKPQSVIGRMEIPSLDLSVMILEGVEESDLRLGVGHVPGTALPGKAGNVAIAGHRDTFFRPLRKIRRNDIITLTTLQGSHRYQVESARITRPDDTAVLRGDSEPVLTLITCFPFSYIGPAPDRFIVHARKLGE